VKLVQARLGHKSAEETLNTYSHLWPDSDDPHAVCHRCGSASRARTRNRWFCGLPAGSPTQERRH